MVREAGSREVPRGVAARMSRQTVLIIGWRWRGFAGLRDCGIKTDEYESRMERVSTDIEVDR
ncbi:hypothetical protein IF1G_08599 [Cordyceps javanica]|uniref:Uncharacterized protein n=1 Tax=Cordyceps javanica TaxID=43265 RepID=A0A545UTB7_9HYPO|nr:hypothetical protein IF1G_08599 [Cordyceps javanica]